MAETVDGSGAPGEPPALFDELPDELPDDLPGEPFRPKSRVRTVSFDVDGVDLIAGALRVPVGMAEFRLPNAAVYQLMVPGDNERPAAMVTLWPSIRRVDAIGPQVAVVFTDVIGVDLVDDIEVQFRRRHGEMLIVARGGKIIVRA